LLIDISFAGSHYLTALSSLKGAPSSAIKRKCFALLSSLGTDALVAGRKDVPPATSDRFIFKAKWNIYLAKSPDRHMKAPRASKLVVVIDDDPLVLEATGGLLRSWGFQVVAAESHAEAMAQLAEQGRRPDLIVCDYRLSEGARGTDVIERLRSAFEIPALLISGDATSPESDDGAGGYRLLHKPVNAETFRAVLLDASVLRPLR
jgi:CheY-like chemotaxis protein